MKSSMLKSTMLSLFLLLGASFAGAATLTVGPGMQYATPCPAIKAASPGDTITIDYNNGIPYQEPPDPTSGNRSDCVWYTNGLTIVGVNGRPILDASGEIIQKAILDDHGGDTVISNLELRNAATPAGQGNNGSGIRIEYGNATTPYGGNVTVQFCYIHNNQDGVLTNDVGPGSGEGIYPDQVAYYSNPYVTLMYDEFYYNGSNTNSPGTSHNIYNGFDGNHTQVFTMEYSWSHDSLVGHDLKTRAPYNDVYYNMIGDALGNSSFILDFPLGGSTYFVGNIAYKVAVTNGQANKQWMFWRDLHDNYSYDPVYSTPNEDLHFVNNTVVLNSQDEGPSFIITACDNSDFTTCGAPDNGPVLTTDEVVQNNIFVGPFTEVTNQLSAVQSNNLVEANTPANLAALFVDPAHLNYHLVAGAPAIQAGLYPPTDNTYTADPKALPADEYVPATAGVTRPTPSGSHMDEGAYSYPRADTPPTPSLSYTQSVTTPGTGTITLTGLPTPPAGQYNVAGFVSEDPSVLTVSSATSATGTLTTTFSVCCASTQTVVPVDIYVDGAYLTANVTVVPGAVALQSITLDNASYPQTTVHLTNAPSSPIVVDLSTSNASILYVPSSVTIPAGALSAETGSEIGSLWGQTPSSQTATITATYGGNNVSLPVAVLTPHLIHFYCNVYDPKCQVVGGTTVNIAAGISTDFPPGGGPVNFYSDTPSVIPNQSFTEPEGNWSTTFNLTTNPVTTSTNVTITINVNGSTSGPYGSQVVVTVTPSGVTLPGSPSGLTATAVSSNEIDLSWSASATPGVTYSVFRSTSNYVTDSVSNQIASNLNALTYADTTAAPGTTYYYVVDAVNSSGPSSVSNQASATTPGGSGLPGAPSALGAMAASASEIDLSWTASSTSGVTYSVFRGTTSGFTPGSGNQVASGLSGLTYANTGLAASTTYYYLVEAVDSAGSSGASNQASATTQAASGTDVFDLDLGGYGSGIWVPDGHPSTYCTNVDGDATNSAINVSGVTNPAPQEVYQWERVAWASIGSFTCTIPGLTPNASYTVRLHFAELYYTAPGQREFNVLINGTQVLTNFDVFAAAGAVNKAVVESFPATADSNGKIAVEYENGAVDLATGNGIEIQTNTLPGAPSGLAATAASSTQVNLTWLASPTSGVTYSVFRGATSGFTPSAGNQVASGLSALTYSDTTVVASTTYYYLVEAVNGNGPSAPSNQASATTPAGSGTQVFALDLDGYGSGTWVPDGHPSTYCTNADGDATNSYIDVSGVTNPAPQEVYQWERETFPSIGSMTCTIPGLTPNASYTVRLHFAEIAVNGPGQREENVFINGNQVLTNFDIFATADAWNKAVIESFPATADSNGKIAVEYVDGAVGSAVGSGIEIVQ